MRIGSVQLESNLFLAPLAGYTNLAFRVLIRQLGGLGMATTELVNARSLLEKNPKALRLVQSQPADRPLAIQLFGGKPEEMRDAAALAESLGADVVDVNMGCPVRKVCRVGAGAALLTQLNKAAGMVKAMVEAVKIPVTAKMRLGWDDQNITAPELARALEDVGVAAVFVHGRTRAQGFGGIVNLAGIRAVVEAVKSIPVIGNGDVTTPEAAKFMMEQTGCAGVSIGRGAFYNPWIFMQTRHYLDTGELLPEPEFEQRVEFMCKHLELMIEQFGEPLACRMFRKIAPLYAKRFGPNSFFNKRVVQVSTRAEFAELLDQYRQWRSQFCDASGRLKPQYQPRPLVPSFMQPGAPLEPDEFPGARGAVELW
ncbi:MAG: tRNA dihydrouridine synthase DusB [Verrucomicrobiae bacterium]|nr:tRNA dihydrouridine synthase DusB [Verrucomicrobiae bacterium]